MEKKDLEWYSPLLFLVGAILSFADPITDILTLVEFYRADHKTWFGVGLAFVILPCFSFMLVYCVRISDQNQYSGTRKCTQTILCGFHPFSVALVRLEVFVFYIKKWWRGDKIDSDDNEKADELLAHSELAVLIESVLESAPQFVLQLYAISVQEEPVEVIQIISLPVSLLSLAWAFTIADQGIHGEDIGDLKLKHKLALFVTHLLLLGSRLFAFCYFIVSYKWWIIGVLLFHTSVIIIADCISFGECECCKHCALALVLYGHWLRDDISFACFEEDDPKKTVLRIQVLSNVLFVSENFFMIMLFYISQHSNTWYSFPVTVCVCLFSVVGSVTRVVHFHFLYKNRSDQSRSQGPSPPGIQIERF